MKNPLTMLRRLGIGPPRADVRVSAGESRTPRERAALLIDFGGAASKFYELHKRAISYEGILTEIRRSYDVVTAIVVMPELYLSSMTCYVHEFEMMGYTVHVVSSLDYDRRERRDRVDDTILSEARLWLSHGNVDVAVLITEHAAVSAERTRIEAATGKKFVSIAPSRDAEKYAAKEHESALYPQLFIKAEDVREIIALARKNDPIPEVLKETAKLIATLFAAFSSTSQRWISAAETLDRMKTIAWEHNKHLHPSVARMLYRVFTECGVLQRRNNRWGKERFTLALEQVAPQEEKGEQYTTLAVYG